MPLTARAPRRPPARLRRNGCTSFCASGRQGSDRSFTPAAALPALQTAGMARQPAREPCANSNRAQPDDSGREKGNRHRRPAGELCIWPSSRRRERRLREASLDELEAEHIKRIIMSTPSLGEAAQILWHRSRHALIPEAQSGWALHPGPAQGGRNNGQCRRPRGKLAMPRRLGSFSLRGKTN